MTIQNKDWLNAQIIRLTLNGFSQEEISHELGVSEGTVNAKIQELNASDDMLRLQHEIAVVSEKTGQSIKELASNMAFANAIKRMGFEQNKIHSILRAINRIFVRDGSLKPDSVASLISQIFNLILKNRVSLDRLYNEIEAKYSELNKLVEEINKAKILLAKLQNEKKEKLAEYHLTLKELNKFARLRENFEDVGLDFENREDIQNVLWDIREMDQDAKAIIDEVKKIRLLKITIVQLEGECKDLEKNLDIYKKQKQELESSWNFLAPTIEFMKSLLQRGIEPLSIYKIFDVISKHLDYLSINDLSKDIDIYGGIVGAIYKKKREFKSLNMSMQSLDDSRDVVRYS